MALPPTINPFKLSVQRTAADAVLAVLNGYLNLFIDSRNEPPFLDIDATAPLLRRLGQQVGVIREELDCLLAGTTALPRYHELDPHVTRISKHADPSKNWRVFLLYAMGEIPEAARRLTPKTLELVLRLPGLYQAFFSVLDPGTGVPAHHGPYRGYLRYHLGLRVPTENPPTLRVRGEVRAWKDGEEFLFDDFSDHEVRNVCAERRTVLIVDVLRPFPPIPAAINQWFARRIGRWFYGRGLIKNLR